MFSDWHEEAIGKHHNRAYQPPKNFNFLFFSKIRRKPSLRRGAVTVNLLFPIFCNIASIRQFYCGTTDKRFRLWLQ